MAITVVNSLAQGSASGNGFTTTGLNCSGANFLAVLSTVDPATYALTDSQSNTWLYQSGPTSYAGVYAALWYCVNPSVGSSHTFSIGGSGDTPSLVILAIAGADTTSPLDQISAGDSNLFTNVIQPGSVTPGSANEIVIAGAAGIIDDTTSMSVNGGFTGVSLAQANSLHNAASLAYLIQTTATAANSTFTGSAGGLTLSSKSITIKSGGGGGPTQYNQSVSGALTFAGTLIKQTRRSLTGGFTPAGTLFKQTSKLLSGGFTPSGTLARTKVSLKSLTGALTFSGTLTKQTQKNLTGGLTFAGVLSKQTSKVLAGVLTFSGVLQKQTSKLLAGVLTFNGTLTRNIIASKTLAGVLTFVGVLNTLLIPYVPPTGNNKPLTRNRRWDRYP